MITLTLGVLLWSGAHLFKRVAPDARANLGDKGRGLVAATLFLSIVLMVIGYRMADGPVWWGRTPALTGINNLLVLAAFYLFASSGMKTRVTRLTRHPQLIGFSLWAVGHLLVNGDLPSVILFGGLLIWAIAEMTIINAQDGPYTPPHPVPVKKEAMAVVAALVVFSVVAGIHWLIGYPPFG
jgi:uncharacterized membrane protein